MIKFQGTALIHSISQVIEIPSKTGGQPFQKRELILDDSRKKDGNTYYSYVVIEFTGEKMYQLDNFAPGQRVTVEGFISGRANQDRVYNTIKGISVVPYQAQQTSFSMQQSAAPTYPQQPAYTQQPTYPNAPAYPQQPAYGNQGYQRQGGYAQPPAPAPMPGGTGNLGPDDLPFR